MIAKFLLSMFLALICTCSFLHAQTPSVPGWGAMVTSRFVPNDAIALLTVSPSELLTNPTFQMFPVEVLQAQSIDQIGVDIADVEFVKVVVAMPGPSGPVGGIVVEFSKDISVKDLNPERLLSVDPVDVDGLSAYPVNDTPGLLLHFVDARTAILAPEFYLSSMVKANNGTGPLAKLIEKMKRTKGVTLVAVMEPLRPMLSGFVEQQVAPDLPPQLKPLAKIPQWVDAVLINANLTPTGPGTQITLLCRDDAAAAELKTSLTNAVDFGKEMLITQVPMEIEGSERVQLATEQYKKRLATHIAEMIQPKAAGRKVSLELKADTGIATTGVLVGLLLPAVQASREAARRMSGMNGIKQVLLAMHNYAATYNRFPAAAIVDENGNPLLSWRVAILPFVEEQALYEQFHLDEPWDSEHNFPLSQMLPAIYADPSAVLPPGYTVIHAVTGEHMGLSPTGVRGFQHFTDGTSNSILVVEVNRDLAVPWSKPEDVNLDADNPVELMGNSHAGGFNIGMADGSVRFISSAIDIALFKALLTCDGGEPVTAP